MSAPPEWESAARPGSASTEFQINGPYSLSQPIEDRKGNARSHDNLRALCCDCGRKGVLGRDLQHCWVSGEQFHIHRSCAYAWAQCHHSQTEAL
jgi:hypothetical protein